jgi:hypothetical protein
LTYIIQPVRKAAGLIAIESGGCSVELWGGHRKNVIQVQATPTSTIHRLIDRVLEIRKLADLTVIERGRHSVGFCRSGVDEVRSIIIVFVGYRLRLLWNNELSEREVKGERWGCHWLLCWGSCVSGILILRIQSHKRG